MAKYLIVGTYTPEEMDAVAGRAVDVRPPGE